MQPSENPYVSPRVASVCAPVLSNLQLAKRRLFPPALVTVIGGIVMTFISAQQMHFFIVTSLQLSNRPSSASHCETLAIFMSLLLMGCLFCIYGGVQMLRIKHHAVCVVAALVMAIPFTSPCLWMGPVFGIWAIVILLRKGTRAAFTASGHPS